jgi:hypothetical protein
LAFFISFFYYFASTGNKAFKKLGIHRVGTRAAEILGIKKILKKILKFV